MIPNHFNCLGLLSKLSCPKLFYIKHNELTFVFIKVICLDFLVTTNKKNDFQKLVKLNKRRLIGLGQNRE